MFTPQDNQKKIPAADIVFYFLLLLLAVLVFSHFTELEKIFALFKQINPFWFVLALLTQVFTYFFTANIYHSLLALYDNESAISRSDLFKVSIISLFLSQAIPTAGLSGGSYLVHFLQKKKLSPRNSFSVFILGIFCSYFCNLLALFFSIFYMAATIGRDWDGSLTAVIVVGIFLLIFLSAISLFFGSKNATAYISGKIEKHKWLKRIVDKSQLKLPGEEVPDANWESPWKIVKNKFHYLWRPIFWQFMEFLADTATIFLLLYGLNFRSKFLIIFVGLILTKIVSLVAISPGGLIFFEGAMVLFYNTFGIPLDLAVVVTLMFRALSFWLPMPLGLFLYGHLNNSNSKGKGEQPTS